MMSHILLQNKSLKLNKLFEIWISRRIVTKNNLRDYDGDTAHMGEQLSYS